MKTTLITLALMTTSAWGFYSPMPKDEDVSRLLEGKRQITSLTQISRLGLNTGSTSIDLWSGPYWALYQGSVALRYQDPTFQILIDQETQWGTHKALYEKLPLYSYAGRENLLSPAEKYDLLVGDPEMSLTKYAWSVGEKNAVEGKVKTWRGICDGWASASQKMPRPTKSVTLKSPAGVDLTFTPEDIKALGSLMYARSQGPVIFLGKRCRSAVLSVFTGSCEETNPATFHLALVNRVGVLKKSFIADVSPNKEVWNYPISSYKVTYYNVFDGTETVNFEEAKEPFINKSSFARSGRRHERTSFIVGVKLEVNYKDMRKSPNLLASDDVSSDTTLSKVYVYDLELDGNNNILGGESFSKNLPDFIWAPNDVTYPRSDAEKQNPRLPLVSLSQAAAQKGQPLAKVVEKLFELSK